MWSGSNANAMESSSSSSGGGVKMVEIQGKGRALVSTGPLRGGSIILRETPILVYSALPLFINNHNHNHSYCFNCFRTLKSQSQALSCPSCSHVFFCSPNCQSLSLSSHSQSQSQSHSPWVCHTLLHLRQHSTSLDHNQDLQVQARFLVAAYNLSIVSPSHFQILLSLHGQPSSHDFAAAHLLHSLISPPPPLPPGQGLFSVDLSASLLAKDKLNAFGLMEPPSDVDVSDGGLRTVRAYGIYPKASLFNHDCLPNACRFDYVDSAAPDETNTDLIFRLIHDVPQGREICLSYFPVNLNYSNRQKRLLEDYGFICECDRCKVEANWSDKEEDDHESMDEDEDEDEDEAMSATATSSSGDRREDDDFPHSYFFLRYVCNRDNCWGTLAPLPPSDADANAHDAFLECNVCANLKKDDE